MTGHWFLFKFKINIWTKFSDQEFVSLIRYRVIKLSQNSRKLVVWILNLNVFVDNINKLHHTRLTDYLSGIGYVRLMDKALPGCCLCSEQNAEWMLIFHRESPINNSPHTFILLHSSHKVLSNQLPINLVKMALRRWGVQLFAGDCQVRSVLWQETGGGVRPCVYVLPCWCNPGNQPPDTAPPPHLSRGKASLGQAVTLWGNERRRSENSGRYQICRVLTW